MNRVWNDISKSYIVALAIAFCCLLSTSLAAQKVGLFYNPSFVDIQEGSLFAEASNLNATIQYLGYEVVLLQNLSNLESQGIDILIIPELEKLSLLVDEGWNQILEIQSYVERGGGLIIMGVVSTVQSNNNLSLIHI